jgi:hypothetical protein
MVQARHTPSPEREAIIEWTARMGAITAEALAYRHGMSVASVRRRLLAAERARLLSRSHPLRGAPALYTATRAGLHSCGLHGLDPCRVTASNALHSIVCADVAAALERCYPDHQVRGERELRRDERERGRALASAQLGGGGSGDPRLHRPDLVLWPEPPEKGLPVAVEVELTIKAPRRLLGICLAWARCRSVAGVLYLVSPKVEHAAGRAIEAADASERIALVPLDALPGPRSTAIAQAERTVPGDA